MASKSLPLNFTTRCPEPSGIHKSSTDGVAFAAVFTIGIYPLQGSPKPIDDHAPSPSRHDPDGINTRPHWVQRFGLGFAALRIRVSRAGEAAVS